MDEHHCLLCMGSNTNRYAQLSVAREALRATFPDIHFGEMMETEAVGSGFHSPFSNQLAKFSTTLSPDSVHDLFKELERRCGRIPEDKAQGVVKLDIDLLVFDNKILKPEDMKREYIRRGMSVLFRIYTFYILIIIHLVITRLHIPLQQTIVLLKGPA